jgi:hypothetical protein
MIKTTGLHGMTSVTFMLDLSVGAGEAAVCGEWNDWSPERDVMERTEEGFRRTVELKPGRTYRFRYLLDRCRWENDWAADGYVPNDHGSDDSLVDLIAPAEETPSAEAHTDTTSSESPAKKRPAAKKAASRRRVDPVKGASPELVQPDKPVEGPQQVTRKPARGATKKSVK